MDDLHQLPTLAQVLEDEEPPSTFGSLFRFIQRPGYGVRNLMTGDFEGFLRNGFQFMQELFMGGMLNQNFTLSNILGFRRDITSAAQRPEFTDVLHKWGVLDKNSLSGASKLGFDLIGGIFTDPLTLLGGPKSPGGLAGSMGKGGIAAGNELAHAMKVGGLADDLARSVKSVLAGDDLVRGIAPVQGVFRKGTFDGTATGLAPLGMKEWAPRVAGVAGDVTRASRDVLRRHADDVSGLITEAQRGPIQVGRKARITPERAAAMARGVEQRAANHALFKKLGDAGFDLSRMGKLLPTDPAAVQGFMQGAHSADDFVNLVRGSQRFGFVPESALANAPVEITRGMLPSIGTYKALDVTLHGQKFKLLTRPGNEGIAQAAAEAFDDARQLVQGGAGRGVTAEEVARLSGARLRDGFRTLGYHDDWIKAHLSSGWTPGLTPGVVDEVVKDLGHWNKLLLETPMSVIDEGIQALTKAGMAPSSGLGWRLPERIGKWAGQKTGWQYTQGHLYMPWSAVGKATLPGAARKAAHAAGLPGAQMVDDLASAWWNWTTRSFYDRFLPSVGGKLLAGGSAVTEAGRRLYYQQVGNNQGHFNDVVKHIAEPFRELSERQALANYQAMAEEALHQMDSGVEKIDTALTGTRYAQRAFSTRMETEAEALAVSTIAGAGNPAASTQILARGMPTPRPLKSVEAMTETLKPGTAVRGIDYRSFREKIAPELDELQDAINKFLPNNPRIDRGSMATLAGYAGSSNPIVARAARKAKKVVEEWDQFDKATDAAKAAYRKVSADLDEVYDGMIQAKGLVSADKAVLEGADNSLTTWRRLQVERARTAKEMERVANLRQHVQTSLREGPAQEARFDLLTAELKRDFDKLKEAHDLHTAEIRTLGQRLHKRARGLPGRTTVEGAPTQGAGWQERLDVLEDIYGHTMQAWFRALDTQVAGKDLLFQRLLKRDESMHTLLRESRSSFMAKELYDSMVKDATAAIAGLRGIVPSDAASLAVLRQQVEAAYTLGNKKLGSIPSFMRFQAKDPIGLGEGWKNLRPAWEVAKDNPFYLPRQVDTRLWEMFHDTGLDKGVREQIYDAFSRKREFGSIKDWRDFLSNTADKLGIDYSDVDELWDRDYAGLVMKRMTAFEHTKARQLLYQEVRKISQARGGEWDTYKKWISGVLSPVRERESKLLKFLGGGKVEVPDSVMKISDDVVRKINESTDNPGFARVRTVKGQRVVTFNWPGMNYVYKPLLTSVPWNVRYHVRNIMAAPAMAAMHPELSPRGTATQVRKAMLNHGIVRWVKGFFSRNPVKEYGPEAASMLRSMPPQQRKDLAATWVVRALTGHGPEREAAWEVLTRLDGKVGKHTWPEVRRGLEKFLGQPIGPADLMAGEEVERMLLRTLAEQPSNNVNWAGKFARFLKKQIEWGEQLAGEAEYRFRSHAFLELLEKGHTIDSAIEAVQKTFVDYSRQSTIERGVRDIIPFARFMIGSLGWAKPMAENPRVLQGLGYAQTSLSGGEGEVQALPFNARESLALPLPWTDEEGNRQFIVSLGLPQETTIQVLSVLGLRPEVLRQRVLGSTQPMLKATGEFVSGRNFYFDTEWGSYRKAPATMRALGMTNEVKSSDGSIRHEVPGWLNEVINASPVGSTESTLNRAFDSRSPLGVRAVNAFFGVRTQSVDTELELKKRMAEFLKDRVLSGQVGELEVHFSRLSPEETPPEVRVVLEAIREEREKRRKARR